MTLAALFVITPNLKQPKCPSTGEWLGKLWHIHAMEHDLAIKRNKVGIPAKAWMNLKNILLSEISQTQDTSYSMI